MKKILFGPFPGGIAHIVRCLAVAERMTDYECVIVAGSDKTDFILQNYQLPKHIRFIKHDARDWDNLSFLQQAQKMKHPKASMLKEIYYHIDVAKKEKPDLVIGDTYFFGYIPGPNLNIPAIWFGLMLQTPFHKRFLGLSKREALQKGLNFFGSKVSNKFLLAMHNQYFKVIRSEKLIDFNGNCKEFLTSMDKVLFEDPKYSIIKKVPNLSYYPLPIGSFEIGNEDGFEELKVKANGLRTAYITLGGTGYSTNLLKKLVKEFLNAGYFVICSTAHIVDPGDLPNSTHLYVKNFLPGYSATCLADLVVSHGSQGTIAHATRSNTPLLAIPFNFDQHLNLDICRNPLIKNMLPLKPKAVLHGLNDYKWLAALPDKISLAAVLEAANAISSKPSKDKKFLKASEDTDRRLIEYISSKLDLRKPNNKVS